MRKPHRREVLALGAAAGAGLLGGGLLRRSRRLFAHEAAAEPVRRQIPSACWQCVGRCPILGTVVDGRVVKIDGNPASLATRGRICAKGQAGVNQVNNPDRLLWPIVRTGARGEGKWKRIGWDEALGLLVEGGLIAGRRVRGLRALREAGTPEKFLFHFGRSVGSDRAIVERFLDAYGTGTVASHDSICMAAGGVADELSGEPALFRDFAAAGMILSFGNSALEAGLDHNATVQRLVEALARGTRFVAFDPRLSNTAARASEWVPLKPGTDLAVLLAMCHAIVAAGLHDRASFEEITNVSLAEIEAHLAPYTPEWAEERSGVPAAKIRAIALEYASKRPGICLSARGAFMHHNGVQTQRAVHLLQALTGNVLPNGPRAARVSWKYPFPAPEPAARKLPILDGEPGRYPAPMGGVSHQMLRRIEAGPERPDIYLVYCHNPVYSNGQCDENARILADETKVPFLVAVDVTLSESSMLADLVLPDATYLERFTIDGKTTHEGVAEYQLRQPMHAPRGEARAFADVACAIAARLGLKLGFSSAEDFVRASCDATPGVREAGGFEYMKAHGIWQDPVIPEPGGEKRRVAIRSDALAKAGFPALPSWDAVPGHETMREDELALVTFKVNVHTQSRTQNCKWLAEIYHENRAWMHPRAAAARGLHDGDRVVVRSEAGALATRVKVTEGIHPRAIAISHSAGHWAHGEYASGRRTPFHREEADGKLLWWRDHGAHVNRIIPLRADPIAGSMCWNDTVVTVARAEA